MSIIKTATGLVITRKMSGTGTIHDLASDRFDRSIKFAPGCKFAVVLAAYYGGKGYTSHKTAEAAAAMDRQLTKAGYSCRTLDANGNEVN